MPSLVNMYDNLRRSLKLTHSQGHDRKLPEFVLKAVAAHFLPLQLDEPLLDFCPSLQQLILANLGQLGENFHFKIDVVFSKDGQGAVDISFPNAFG